MNALGLELLKQFEGCRLTAYQDQGNVWTIGYGHTGPGVTDGLTWTQAQADTCLTYDLPAKVYSYMDCVTTELTDNQYAAVCCLVFNIGVGAFRKSKTLECINNSVDPTSEWLGFDHVNGVVNQGLLNRRKAEVYLWSLS